MDLKNLKNFFKALQPISQHDVNKELEKYQEERIKYNLGYNYYHPCITREQSEQLLKDAYKRSPCGDGIFLIRKSSSNPKDFSLSMIFSQNVYHFQIKHQIDAYFLMSHSRIGLYHGLDSLVHHFQEKSQGLPCVLSTQFVACEFLPKKYQLHGCTSPLHLCAQNLDTYSFKKFKLMLTSPLCQKDLNENDENGRSILDYACEYNNTPVLKELIACGNNVNVKSADGYTPVHRAAQNNSVEALQLLLEQPNISPIERNLLDMNQTPLHYAAKHNKFYCVKLLLDHGVPHQPRNMRDLTPLDLAYENNSQESIEILESYVPSLTKIKLNDFMHDSSVNREIAYDILKNSLKNNDDCVFLVRLSTRTNALNVHSILSILTRQDSFFNYEICKKNECFYIDDGPYFASLELLIEHYMKFEDGLSTRLKHPCMSLDTIKFLSPIIDEKSNKFARITYPNNHLTSTPATLRVEEAKLLSIKRSDIKLCDVRLGEGEFGEVFKGVYKSKQVAIKILKDFTAKDEFKREAEIMSKLGDHPCILKIYGLVDDKKGLMMIQELMSCGILQKLWETPKSVNESHLKKWSTQIINGMVHMESKKIVHRDLAARNILLATEYQIKISDFGLSRVTNEEIYTQQSDGKIPIKWYAPESIELCKFTSKSDVWSFGITLWEMFTYGDVPYGDKNGTQVYQFIKNDKRLACPRGCPPNTYEIMKKCWEWDESKRPSFRQLLNEFIKDTSYGDTGTIYFSNNGFIKK